MTFPIITQTICPICKKPLNGEYIQMGNFVYFVIDCPEHGKSTVLASEDVEAFIRWTQFQSINVPPKVALTKGASKNSEYGTECPLHCGTCENHLMTACCVLLDITERCNQHCPWCFANADESPDSDPALETIEHWYDTLVEIGEERPFNIQLSGGEPTVRDDLPEIIKMGREKGFEYIQLNTNGKRLGQDAEFTRTLANAGLTTVFLQFDGMNDEINEVMRGEPLLDIKMKAIENCKKVGLPVTLVPTVLKDVNLSDIGNLFKFMIDNVNVIKGIHFQPASFFGRLPEKALVEKEKQNESERVTMFAVMNEIEKQTEGRISKSDLVPISTGHPLCCFCSSFLLEKDGSITSLLSNQQKEEGSSCCCGPEQEPLEIIRKDRDFVLNKWTVENDNCETEPNSDSCCCDKAAEEDIPSLDEALAYIRSHMFTITGMAFMDESNLDAERLKRCRVQVMTEDERLIPFCSYNSIYRGN